MERLPVSEAQWIKENTKPWIIEDLKKNGSTVQHVVPGFYQSYAKLFHPFEINFEQTDKLEPNPDYGTPIPIHLTRTNDGDFIATEIKEDGSTLDLYEEYKKRVERRAQMKLVYTSWQSVALKYGLHFHEEINQSSFSARFREIGWPRNLLFPREGYLVRPLLLQLLLILKEHTVNNEVYIYQLVPNSIMKDGRIDDLVKCSLEEVTEYFPKDFIGYMYAANRSWMVYTDTDLYFTLVGGSKALIETVINSSLEVLPCLPTTRIDHDSDHINKRIDR